MGKDNRVAVRKVLLVTLLLNLSVTILKAILAWWTGSLSLFSDALHSVTDSSNNILGLVANNMSSPEPDRDHPYGHQKFEAIGALGIAGFISVAGFEILQTAIERMLKGTELVKVSALELWLLLIVLGVNIFLAYYEDGEGQRLSSPILIADAKHTMSDGWITLTVLTGLIGVWQGQESGIPLLPWLDVILAFPVAFLVLSSSWEVLKENLPWLVDAIAIAPEEIHAISMSVPGVINCHDIASRGVVGRQVFIEMHLVIYSSDIETAHYIAEEVEARLRERYGAVRVAIRVEPHGCQSDQISYESATD